MTKRFLIAANWKMNLPPKGFDDVSAPYAGRQNVDVVVFPTFLHLRECIAADLAVGAQHGRPETSGAFTGDVSLAMLKGLGCEYALCGHSERRKNHGETDEFVRAQAEAALKLGLHPIVCIGETAEERKQGKEQEVVGRQLRGLPKKITIAYEPVWAISGGDPTTPAAGPRDAQHMHAFIRSLLPHGKSTKILYGGSMNAKNCEELLKCPDVDGGLVGGASLQPQEFAQIVEIAAKLASV